LKNLIRERKDIDTAISDFERLEAHLPTKGEESRPISNAKPKKLIEMKRKP